MAVSFNRYLILPEIERSESGAASAAVAGLDGEIRSYTSESVVSRSYCSTIAGTTTVAAVTPLTVPLCVLGDVQLRFLCPDDLEEVRSLCQDWFPIDYPYSWYEDITSSSRFYALAAVYGGVIIGLIVAEIKSYTKLNKEDRGILCSSLGKDCLIGYILSLGVRRTYRRNGIASLLLEQLLAHVTAPERSSVKAVFLHVLSSNVPAILFYQRCHFRLHSFLPYYYSIRGKCKDGFTYVLYVNGGHAPWGIWDWLRYLAGAMTNFVPCRVPRWIWQRLLWASTVLSYHR
ncbi:N-alpha-acetyltransferase 60 [Odontomachus brunneus]|uniref:N-alpha-acetyltransferase 60 n=1 Tax=Odontomachus brunneus TaxID=486640 RepID=UPI0013F26A5B|nr:N-alpha-acetyltransferase 60 [Odontomachus brunneus]